MAKKASTPRVQNTEENEQDDPLRNVETQQGSSIDTFEEDLTEVERIVRQLEGGQLSLAEALKEYETGVGRLKRCYASLEDAQRRVELLTGVDSDGNPLTEAYESTSLSLEQKQATRGRRRGAASGSEPRQPSKHSSFFDNSDESGSSDDFSESMDDAGELF